jgi:hypothetical protein
MPATRIGRCACGQLTATCVGEPLRVSLCHCEDCQKRTGSAFGIAVFFGKGDVALGGRRTTFTRPSDSGFPVAFHFCPECGSTVCWEPSRMPDRIAVAYGAFAGTDMPAPEQQVYVQRRHGWLKTDMPVK